MLSLLIHILYCMYCTGNRLRGSPCFTSVETLFKQIFHYGKPLGISLRGSLKFIVLFQSVCIKLQALLKVSLSFFIALLHLFLTCLLLCLFGNLLWTKVLTLLLISTIMAMWECSKCNRKMASAGTYSYENWRISLVAIGKKKVWH
jgi:hypothetical protein